MAAPPPGPPPIPAPPTQGVPAAAAGSELPPPGPGRVPAASRATKPLSKRARIALAGVAVLLVAAVVALVALPGGDDGDGDEETSTGQDAEASPAAAQDPPDPDVPVPPRPHVPPAPEPTLPPPTGTPPSSSVAEIQALIDGCASSALDDCDRLYTATDDDAESAFARTCGGRLDAEDANGDCIVTFDAIPTETDPELQTLIDGCGGDAVDDCDRLYNTSDTGPAHTYAQTCGHRLDDDEASGDCIVRFDAIPTDTDSEDQALIDGCGGDAVDDCDRLYNTTDGGPAHTYAQTCGHRLDDEASGDCIVILEVVPTDADADVQALIDGCGEAVDDCDRLYETTDGGPAHTYAQTCGHRLDDDEASGDCGGRVSSAD